MTGRCCCVFFAGGEQSSPDQPGNRRCLFRQFLAETFIWGSEWALGVLFRVRRIPVHRRRSGNYPENEDLET